jgi:LCP family protein required for cell wall assembly
MPRENSAPRTIARHGRLPHRGISRSLIALLGIAVAVVLVATGSVSAIALYRLNGVVQSKTVDIKPKGSASAQVGSIDGPVNLLIVGSDSGDGNAAYGKRGENLNDVTILIHISPKSKSATAISFPRDLWTEQAACTSDEGKSVPASGPRKFNEGLYRGGLSCVAAEVTGLTGLDVDYAGLIEFDGVVEMSNALGGVTVCLASPMKDRYTGLNLPAGENTLQGAGALAFLRSRHGLAEGSDLARISNQQVFLSALMRQVKSSETLTNPIKLYGLATAAAEHMTLSKELASPTTMVSIALALKDIPLDRITFIQYPNSPKTINGQSVTIAQTSLAKTLVQAVKDDKAVVAGSAGKAQVTQAPTAGTPTTAPATTGTPNPTDSATPGTGTTDDGSGAVQLPEGVTGQSASDQTCSRGSSG